MDGFYADNTALFDSILLAVESLKLYYIRLLQEEYVFMLTYECTQHLTTLRMIGKLLTVNVSVSCGVLVLPFLYTSVTV